MHMRINKLSTVTRSLLAQVSILPNQFIALALFVACINIASDVSNTFPSIPYGGGAMAFLAFGAIGTAFLIIFIATTVPFPDFSLSSHLHIAVLIVLFGWGLWTVGQSIIVMASGWSAAFSSTASYGSDELYFAQYNAVLVLHGENPYTGDHLAQALRYFHTDKVTVLRLDKPLAYPTRSHIAAIVNAYLADPAVVPPELASVSTHSYPAMSFLLILPIVWLGLPSIGILQALTLLCLMALLIALTPRQYRWLMTGIVLLDVDGIRSVASSDLAIWPVVGLALLWFLREHRWWASMIFGVTMAIQQTAWFAAPFYLIWVIRRRGWLAGFQECAVGIGVFFAVNLPWIIQSPMAWLRSLFLPMTLPLYPDGSGFIRLALAGAIPLWQPIIYSLIEFGVWIVLLIVAWRRYPQQPFLGIVLPFAALLFAWRSPSRYFILLPFLAILAVLLTMQMQRATVYQE